MIKTNHNFGFLLLVTVFLFAFRIPAEGFNFYINYLLCTLLAIFYIGKNGKIPVKKTFNIYFTAFTVLSVFLALINYYNVSNVFEQFFVIIFFTNIYFLVFHSYKYDIKAIISTYLKISYFVSLIGIIEEISHLLGFTLTFLSKNVSIVEFGLIRISSITSEPAHLVVLLIPAVFIISMNIIIRFDIKLTKFQKFTIVLAYLLTFSTTGLFGLFICVFILIFLKFNIKMLAITFLSIFIFSMVINKFELINTRIVDTQNVLINENYDDANISTMTLYSNLQVAINSFKENPLMGSGLGTHNDNYMKYINKIASEVQLEMQLNTYDASSLLLRLITETGFLGLILFYGFIIKFSLFRKKPLNNDQFILKAANLGILAMVIMKSARSGNYIINGFPFFLLLYYYTYIKFSITKLNEVTTD